MPNSLIDLWRKNLADAGTPDDRDDLSLMTDELIPLSKQNPALLTQYPDFAKEVYSLRDANAGSVTSEFTRGFKSGAEGTGATYAGMGAIMGVPGAAEESKKLDAEAQENPPTIDSMQDVHSPKDALRYVAAKTGEALPSLAEMAGLSTAGAVLGSAVEPGAGTVVGAAEGPIEEILGRGIIKKAIKEAVESGAFKGTEEEAIAALRAGDQKTADLVTKAAKNIAGRHAGEATNIANLYTMGAGGIYNETGDKKTALGLGFASAIAGALPGISLPSQVVKSLFPKLTGEAAEAAAKEYVGNAATKILSKLGKVAAGTASGTAGMVGMEAVNIAAKNITQGKDPLTLEDDDWKRLREAAVGGALASLPLAGIAARTPGAEPTVTPTAQEPEEVPAPQAAAPTPAPAGTPAPVLPTSTPALDIMRRVNGYSPDEARARLSELANNPQRSPADEKEFQVLRATAPSKDLPAPTPPPEAAQTPAPTAVAIGPRDPTVSTGTGVETPHETDMMAKWKADVAAQASGDVPTFKDAGFESQEAFDAEYAKSHLAEHFETAEEFARRLYCQSAA